jgi:hypothetical protein
MAGDNRRREQQILLDQPHRAIDCIANRDVHAVGRVGGASAAGDVASCDAAQAEYQGGDGEKDEKALNICTPAASGKPFGTGGEGRDEDRFLPVALGVRTHSLRVSGCGTVTCAPAPVGVGAPVQYGHRLTAVVIYLLVAQFGAQKRVAQSRRGSVRGADLAGQRRRDDRPGRATAGRRLPGVCP